MATTDDLARQAQQLPSGGAAFACVWPPFAQAWYGGEYPGRRDLEARQVVGWKCPGCGRCWAPWVACCTCPPAAVPADPAPMGDWQDET